jgi:hypothetical protein
MSPSVFLDRGSPPKPADLAAALGKAANLWTELQARLGATFAPLDEHWSYSGKSYGWLLQLRHRKKTVVNLVPGKDAFVASLALNERGCDAARRAALSDSALEVLEKAPKYPEGRAVRVEVRSKKDLVDVEKLASVRMNG